MVIATLEWSQDGKATSIIAHWPLENQFILLSTGSPSVKLSALGQNIFQFPHSHSRHGLANKRLNLALSRFSHLSQAPPQASVHSGSASSVWFLEPLMFMLPHILLFIEYLGCRSFQSLLLSCSVVAKLFFFLAPGSFSLSISLSCKIAPGHMWLLSTWNVIGQCWDVLSVWNIIRTRLWKPERKSVDCLITSFLYWLYVGWEC